MITKILIILLVLIILYLTVIYIWYLYPSGFWGIKYKNTGDIKINDLKDNPYLFIIDHSEPAFTDIMIMSEEIHNHSDSDKFNLISTKCKGFNANMYYYTKYNIIQTEGDTVKKSIEKINKKENVVFFFKKHFKGKGIYHVLKQNNIPIVLVKKKLVKNPNNKELKNEILKYNGMEYEINYELIKDYDIENKNGEEFMDWVKEKLFD